MGKQTQTRWCAVSAYFRTNAGVGVVDDSERVDAAHKEAVRLLALHDAKRRTVTLDTGVGMQTDGDFWGDEGPDGHRTFMCRLIVYGPVDLLALCDLGFDFETGMEEG